MIELTNGVQLPESSITFLRKVSMDGLALCDPIRLVQYDNTLPVLAATLWVGGVRYIPPDGAVIRIRWYKPDAHGVYNPAMGVGDDGTVYIQITQAMTSAAGTGYGNIEVVVDGGVKCSDPIPATISRNAVQEGAIVSTDEFKTLDQILAEVQALQAQVEQDASTAATDAKRAVSAREAAETAAETVKQIVAGNEAWTKQESNDRFALALKTDTGKGTSHEIYPDEGSNIVVTAYGYTEQDGDGNPSPENIRPITVMRPRYMYQYVFTGEEEFNETTVGGTAKWVTVKPTGFSGTFGEGLLSRYDYLSSTFPNESYPFGYNMAWTSSIYVRHQDLDAVGMKNLFKTEYERGHPFIAWYNKRDSTGVILPTTSGFTWRVKIKADTTQHQRNICLPMTVPMAEGSSIVNVQDGQCVEIHFYKHLELTGEEAWGQNPEGRIFLLLSDAKPYGKAYCSHAKQVNSDPGRFGVVSGGYLTVSPGGQWGDAFSDKDTWKSYLSAQASYGTPVTVVYELISEKSYNHAPVPLIAKPDSTGKVTVSGEKEVSAAYNKSIKKAFEEMNAAILKLGGTQNV